MVTKRKKKAEDNPMEIIANSSPPFMGLYACAIVWVVPEESCKIDLGFLVVPDDQDGI